MHALRDDDPVFDQADETIEQPELLAFWNLVEFGNDAQNAAWFARENAERLLYNATARSWLTYDGARWIRDADGDVMRRAKATAEHMLKLAVDCHSELRQKAVKYAVARSGSRSLKAVVELAQSELPATANQFDRDPYDLNVVNGTLELRSGKLRPHTPQDRLSKLAPVVYDPDARAPRWEQFLSEVFLDRRDLIDYVQRMAGMALTGAVSEHLMFIAYGLGANGKSVFVRTLLALLGDYAMQADVSLFLARKEHGATPELARLKGVRFVAASEMPEGGRLSENLVKSLTGGDRIAARHLYGEIFEFEPTAKFLIATNYKPTIRGDDDGIWRRIKLLPFEASFFGASCDRELAAKLEAELPGILRWAVIGCQRWLEDGLREPEAVSAAVAEYRSDSDAIGSFIDERCVRNDQCESRASALYDEYKAWADTSNERCITVKQFRSKIRQRQFDERKSHGEIIFIGIGLRDRKRDGGG